MRALSFKILLSGVAALALCAALPAAADECSNTTYAGIYSNYPYQDLGIYGSEQPVVQGGNTTTCGSWEFDNWASVGETDKNLGAKEYDLTISYSKDFELPIIGPVRTKTSVAYYAFDFQGLSKTEDDALDFHVDIARPIMAGDVIVTPLVRVTRIQFVDGGGLDFVRPGLRLNGQIDDKWSYGAEFSVSMNRTSDVDTNRAQFDLNYSVSSKWTLNGRVKLTEDLDPMFGGGFAYRW